MARIGSPHSKKFCGEVDDEDGFAGLERHVRRIAIPARE
jgi:hypothetical protein